MTRRERGGERGRDPGWLLSKNRPGICCCLRPSAPARTVNRHQNLDLIQNLQKPTAAMEPEPGPALWAGQAKLSLSDFGLRSLSCLCGRACEPPETCVIGSVAEAPARLSS